MLIRNGSSHLGICINPWIYCLLTQTKYRVFGKKINRHFNNYVAYRLRPEAKVIDMNSSSMFFPQQSSYQGFCLKQNRVKQDLQLLTRSSIKSGVGMIVGHLSSLFRTFQRCQRRLLRSYQIPGYRVQRNDKTDISNILLSAVMNHGQILFVLPLKPTFLTKYFDTRLGYSVVNSANLALSLLIKHLESTHFKNAPIARF